MKGEELLQQFKEGKKPSQLLEKENRNTVYKWYKLFLLLEIQRRVSELILTGKVRQSQKDLEDILKKL